MNHVVGSSLINLLFATPSSQHSCNLINEVVWILSAEVQAFIDGLMVTGASEIILLVTTDQLVLLSSFRRFSDFSSVYFV